MAALSDVNLGADRAVAIVDGVTGLRAEGWREGGDGGWQWQALVPTTQTPPAERAASAPAPAARP
ncbi:MAG: hypothetical protein N2041_14690, partial [Tepidiforma sp.]